ncbi:sugar ABC transporter substrate-binding protein [Actinophytocola oryzae]|uniref:Carbohydrate ABC transporter substrate-binding protein (CUT1 family) n=1 Tax=Actinophytocola oryzae TaxID=502181 RepID=A0A4R7VHT1_9PSEU|nr:sugar ABC transporter substrate-binding protein [Actinophytocola oryzae]TDV48910.1 carbohydrate ABC transporter substrate-binding protein (CUT1 family) [Actinophytocola oryzae]
MTRRLLAALAVVALALSACGRDSEGAGPEQGDAVASGKASGEITVWAMGTEGEKLSVLADDFMKENPDAKVSVTPVPWDGAHNKLAAAIAGQATPDVSMLGTTWVGEFAKTGALDVTPPDFVRKEDFFPGAWETGLVDGTSYSVPWYVETRLLYVNKAVAEKAGISSSPRTWNELFQAAKDMQAKGGAKWGIYLQPGQTGAWQTVMPLVWQNGGDIHDGQNFTLDSPEAVQALEYYKSFYDSGLSTRDRLREGETEPKIISGEIGAFVSGPWHIGLLNELGGKGKFDLWPMPSGSGDFTSFIGGSNMAVFRNSKNRDAAWKFVSYLMQPDVQVKWYGTVSDLPSVQAAWDDESLAGDPQLKVFGDQLDKAKAPPAIPTWEQIAAAVDTELEKLAKGTETADAAAKAMQSQATSIGTGG